MLKNDAYIERKARLLYVEKHRHRLPEEFDELVKWLAAFKEVSKLTDPDTDFNLLDQQALESFILKVGIGPADTAPVKENEIDATPVYEVAEPEEVESKPIPHYRPGVPTYDELLSDYIKFCYHVPIKYRPGMMEHCPKGGYGPFLLNEPQRILTKLVLVLMFERDVPVRLMILKARQHGITTFWLVFWLWMCQRNPGYTVLFIIDKDVHLTEKREELLRIITALEEKFDEFISIRRKAPKVLEFSNRSRILFESALSPNVGTSEAIMALHMSEQPKWPRNRVDQVDASVMPGLPEIPGTVVVNESTAEGMDKFKAEWDRLHTGESTVGDIESIPIFFPWYISSEYRRAPPPSCYRQDKSFVYIDNDLELSEIDVDGQVSMTESEYAKHYDLAPDQIYWRRDQIKRKFKGDKVIFDQEYPTTPSHAWASIGARFAGTALIKGLQNYLEKPIFRGHVEQDLALGPQITALNLCSYRDFYPKVVNDNYKGNFFIFRMPEKDKQYYLGADVAEGKQISVQGRNDPDWSVIWVLDEYGRSVAYFRDRILPEDFAYYIALVGVFYNTALVNCERNKDGATVWSWFKHIGYSNNYYRETERGKIEDLAWSLIGPAGRKPLLNNGRASLRKDPSRARAQILVQELDSLVRDSKGKIEPFGNHDDCFLAYCHAETCRVGLTGRAIVESLPEDEEEDLPWNSAELLFKDNGLDVLWPEDIRDAI